MRTHRRIFQRQLLSDIRAMPRLNVGIRQTRLLLVTYLLTAVVSLLFAFQAWATFRFHHVPDDRFVKWSLFSFAELATRLDKPMSTLPVFAPSPQQTRSTLVGDKKSENSESSLHTSTSEELTENTQDILRYRQQLDRSEFFSGA